MANWLGARQPYNCNVSVPFQLTTSSLIDRNVQGYYPVVPGKVINGHPFTCTQEQNSACTSHSLFTETGHYELLPLSALDTGHYGCREKI